MMELSGPSQPPAAGGKPKQLVALLHGYGSNGEDLIGLAPYWRAALPDTVFISPNAPEPCPGAPGGYQWWSLTSFTPQSSNTEELHVPLNDTLAAELKGKVHALAIKAYAPGEAMG